ncbi:MAG: hypothetical protein JSW58_05060 [Candidatus Latescibacterota bacterium]|nr:MAG: hypothetical protein JSW58_05060 [Candidatus Latescibacterota bacterium]
MRGIFFLAGLAALVAGASSYFEPIPLPIDFSSRMVTVGAAEFRLDFVLMMFGILLMLLGLPSKKPKWK